jgi:hypothetical protein
MRTPDSPRPNPRQITLNLPLPQHTTLTGATAVTGSGALASAIATGNAPTDPVQIFALVTLTVAAMAYDIARRALHTRRT